MNAQQLLSVAEIAFAADVSVKVVQHALARGVVRRASRKREAPVPAAAAYALAVLKHAPVEVRPGDQRALFDSFAGRHGGPWVIERKAGSVTLDVGAVRASLEAKELLAEVARRVHLLARMHHRLERRAEVLSGASVFKGTRAMVDRVGLLLARGVARNELLEDYPQLSDEDLDIARLYVQLAPRPRGRPPKRLKVRRAEPSSATRQLDHPDVEG